MNWGSWQEFWNMGGYGRYVWGAYGCLFALVAIEVVSVRARLARARRAVSRRKRPIA